MYIKSIELKNFRNYEDFSIEFDQDVNLIIGKNAQGKTNLIEAVYLTSMGRSFRTSRDSDLIRFGCDTAFIRVEASKELIDTRVEVMISRNSRKAIKKDGTFVRKTSQLMKNIILVVFSPEDLRIVKDEPEKRRRFIDRELAQIRPAYYNSLGSYKKALMQRNQYLKEETIDENVLLLWDAQIVKYGAEVMRHRKRFIDEMNVFSGRIHSGITDGAEELKIEYDPNQPYADDSAEQEKILEEALRDSFDQDIRMRTTGRGPHKDDVKFFVNGVNVRKFGSQGQQRTCALSLKLAELDFIREETGENGILLLDDVMSELDGARREYLVRALSGIQLFITAAEVDQRLLDAYKDAKIIRIDHGRAVSE
jgi:DNA replication and repair protein RecF